jgi:hypothetical protein
MMAMSISQSDLVLTVQTDKALYTLDDIVKIFGTAMDSGRTPLVNATIGIEARDPGNNTVFLDIVFSASDGTYQDSFGLNPYAPFGLYHVYATAVAEGYLTAFNQTTFTVQMSQVHDVAVIDVSLARTVVGQGFPCEIDTTIQNHGDQEETFNVTVHANTTAINQTRITLASRDLADITITWNTSGFAKGNYTISAVADTVPGETDTLDNTFPGGMILVTIPGDINGDTYVNAKDAVLLGAAFNSNQGQPSYDPNADINGDQWCNAKDAVILGTHFNEHW